MRERSGGADGRLAVRRVRLISWVALPVVVVLAIGGICLSILNHASDIPGEAGVVVSSLLGLFLIGFVVLGFLVAYRRPRNPIGWIIAGTGILGLALDFSESYAVYALYTDPGSLPGGETMAWLSNWIFFPVIFTAPSMLFLLYLGFKAVAGIVGPLSIIPIFLAAGYAVLRYRLYDIDVVINRTLVYGSLTLALIAGYVGAVVVLQRAFVVLTGEESTLAVVASTLLIAALFNPLRRRFQALIDRLFYRKKYDAAKTLEGFSKRLREETDLDTLGGGLVSLARETIQPAHVSLWLRPPEEGR